MDKLFGNYHKLEETFDMKNAVAAINAELDARTRCIKDTVYSLCTDEAETLVFTGGNKEICSFNLVTAGRTRVLQGEQAEITCLGFEGGYLYAGSRDGGLSCWDAYKGECFDRIRAHEAIVYDLALTSAEVITTSGDGTINFHSIVQLHYLRSIELKPVLAFAILVIDNALVAACSDFTIKAWELTELELQPEFSGHEDMVLALCKFQGGLASGSQDKTVRLWTKDGQPNGILTGHTDVVRQVKATHDSKYLVSASEDASIIIWRREGLLCILNTEKPVRVLHLSQSYLFAGVTNHELRIWDLQEKDRITKFQGSNSQIRAISTGTRNQVFTLGNSVNQWDAKSCSLVKTLEFKRVTHLAANERCLAVVDDEGQLSLWPQEEVVTLHSGKVALLAWVSETEVLTVGADGRVVIYDFQQREIIIEGTVVTSQQFYQSQTWLFGWDFNVINAYQFRECRLVKSWETEFPVSELVLSGSEECLALGSNTGTIEVWHFDTLSRQHTLNGHTDKITSMLLPDQYLLTGSLDGTVRVWDASAGLLLGCIPFSTAILTMHSVSEFVYVGTGRGLARLLSPLSFNKPMFLGPQTFTLPFTVYLYQCIRMPHKPPAFQTDMLDWVVMPFAVNLLHLFCYYANSAYVKRCLRSGCLFFKNQMNETPLLISINRQCVDCIEVIAKNIDLNSSAITRHAIEDELAALNHASPSALPMFYENAFPIAEKPMFGIVRGSLPTAQFSPTPLINTQDFIDEGESNPTRVKFHSSLFRLNDTMGSVDSMEFLRSLVETENNEVFRTAFVEEFLLYKWKKARTLIWVRGGMHVLLVLALIYCLFYNYYRVESLLVLGVVNTVYLLMEVVQLLISLKLYYGNMWNVFDFLEIVLIYIYLLQELEIWGIIPNQYQGVEFASILTVVWVRGISYFRVFNNTRYMIRMIVEILKDMFSFLVILTYISIGVSLMYVVVTGNNMVTILINVFRLQFGDFDTDSYTSYADWVWFLLASVLNTLILMNMLIALMGDTYDRVQEFQDVTDLREMASVVLECECLLFWKKRKGSMKYFQVCSDYSSTKKAQDEWQGRIQAIKQQITLLEKNQGTLDSIVSQKLDHAARQVQALEDLSKYRFGDVERKVANVSEAYRKFKFG